MFAHTSAYLPLLILSPIYAEGIFRELAAIIAGLFRHAIKIAAEVNIEFIMKKAHLAVETVKPVIITAQETSRGRPDFFVVIVIQ